MSQTIPTVRANLGALRDDELLALVARHDEGALGVIYDRYSGLVYTIALRITGDRQTAEEVMQDVFQGVWQTAGSYQAGRGACAAWLIGIARHRAIDATRSRRERARAREQTIEQGAVLETAGGTDPELSDLDVREAVRAALDALPPAQRQAVELAYYGGLTRVEIAERLGEPIGTVKTRLRLGLLKLRDLLRPLAE
ncbi:MAG: sigma-70 family RNA polymerase sigma factor [Chloroflexi bacterium OHK40]